MRDEQSEEASEARSGAAERGPTFGLRPDGYRLPETTHLGPVRLQVGDLARSRAFYEEVVGLALLESEAGRAALGTGMPERRCLVELIERRGARPAPSRGRTGLFHVALLLPSRADLARFVRDLGASGVQAGAGDHLVSEAFYLQDPNNLGLEIYADRPRSVWRANGRELAMRTDPVDLDDLLAAAGDSQWQGAPQGTTVGHVHLHVGDLEAAKAFYLEGLGFDCTAWSYPGALFFAAGGYHHHLGTNIWAGRGASPPERDEAQLIDWTMVLPEDAAREALVEQLRRRGIAVEGGPSAFALRDPWGTCLQVRATDH